MIKLLKWEYSVIHCFVKVLSQKAEDPVPSEVCATAPEVVVVVVVNFFKHGS